MSVLKALAGWNVEATLTGPEPENEAAYQQNVQIINGKRPIWAEVLERSRNLWRQEYVVEIDRLAEQQRQEELTPGSGQLMTYVEKAKEAEAALNIPQPKLAGFPLLSSSLEPNGDSLHAVAKAVLLAKDRWLKNAARIEHVRFQAKRQIAKANSMAEMQQIVEQIIWQT